ncbi:ROK family protein [Clostridium thermobutyricum]|uniref:Beta-glucoside kinase n=1 Tax=Clostridium thermobutyricum DSM 4928 TaxID=1121339 RepID=A0A1V4SZG5_9CLOT|nr:ROK family protein [Clostridium thermobutyricum]OPX49495.1 beta-glucoside kinase [Clostridium thermobutyricum DSM 4928]
MDLFAVIDIGGTSIKYGVITKEGTLIESNDRDTEAYKGGLSIIDKVKEIIKEIRIDNDISGICISTAGMVCPKEGKIVYAGPTIPNYTGVEVKSILEKEFKLPCSVENDVNCAALGEFFDGAGMGTNSMVCLTIGTGIGGAIIIDGKILYGFSNSAGEIGYMMVNGEHIQNIASTTSLVKNVALRKGIDYKSIDGRYVLDNYENGDLICREEVEKLVDNLALGISNIVYSVNPEVVVLGGGIMAREEIFRPLIEKSLKKYLIESVYINTRIEFAKLKNTAGMKGAFYNFNA